MTFGLTATGFQKRTLEDLLQQVEDEEHSEISQSLDTSSSSPMGQLNAVLMKPTAELWDLAQAVYDGGDPAKNEGDAQDAVAAITGTVRHDAQKSYVRETLGLDAGITVPIGSIVSVFGNPSVRFTLVGTEATPGVVVATDVVSTTAGSYYGRFECDHTGPVVVNAGTLSVIVTPVSGWNSATNADDAVEGRDIEGPSDMRTRREDELQAEGTTPVDALRAELLRLEGMVQVSVFENVDDVPDSNGVPAHAIEALCYDGPSPAVADDDIAQTIWDGRSGGIKTYGSTTGTATDSQGNSRTMAFSRPTLKTVYFDITVTTTTSYPGDAALKTAVVAFGESLDMGEDVILAAFYSAIFGLGGVSDILLFKAGFSAAPSGTSNLSIGPRELATFDTSRITVHS